MDLFPKVLVDTGMMSCNVSSSELIHSRQEPVLWLCEIVMKKDRQSCLHDLAVVDWHTFSLCDGFL